MAACSRDVSPCPRDGPPCPDTPCVYDYPSPENSLLYIYSNDGNTLIKTIDMWYMPYMVNLPIIYLENGYNTFPPGFFFIMDSELYTPQYIKPDNIEGYSTSPNSTTTDIADGHVFATGIIHTIYEVPKSEPTGSTLDVTYNSQKIIDGEEVTPPVDVTYNGSTIATLNAGDTKTLDILGSDNKPKILATPIVIGGKTIPDVDALGRKWVLEHNLEVEVGGGSNANG